MNSKLKLIFVHIGFWLLYIIIWGVKDSAYAPTFWDTLDSNIIGACLYALAVYFNLYVLIPNLLFKKQKLTYAVVVIVLVIAVSLSTSQVFSFYFKNIDLGTSQFFGSLQGFANTTADFLVVYGLSTCLFLINEWYIKERKLKDLESFNLKAELDMLKGQINPHFLFNALNSIHVMIRKDADKALSTLEKFSDLLSHQVYEVTQEKVLLEKEVKNLDNFIAIQSIRFADQVDIECRKDGDFNNCYVAPMLFLNFVENAFKHASAKEGEKTKINILLSLHNDQLQFACVNSVGEKAKSNGLGLGLANVKRRIELLYPNKYELEIEPRANEYAVHLNLNLS